MDDSELSPPLRLALAYAPAAARPAWRALLALDARCAGFVRHRREPMLAQIRLAWWRERLGEAPARWPKGEPLLAELAGWGEALPGLVALVDGWEAMLADGPLTAAGIAEFAEGRVAAMAALGTVLGAASPGVADAARVWALVDLAAHVSDGGEREAVLAAARGVRPAGRLARAMRPLAVLAAVARAERDGAARWRQGLAAIRVGICGI